MSAVQFSGSSSSADRRRRRMVTEIDPSMETFDESDPSGIDHADPDTAAFPMLSRDRLIRRVISPRLWKHIAVAVVLTLTPIIYAILTWPPSSGTQSGDSAHFIAQLNGLRGLSGLKLFTAGQFCLLIAWVRSASPVDFRGRFRWWRWLAIALIAISVSILTDTTAGITNLVAQGLEPLFGRIDAARPALLLVPVCGGIALILRRVIPDMGRCRASQSLIVISTILLAVRCFAGARLQAAETQFHMATLELLISGLILSALQLHARFVIHVNPNPPLAAERKSVVRAVPTENNQLQELTGPVTELQHESPVLVEPEAVAKAADVAPDPQPSPVEETTPIRTTLNVKAADDDAESSQRSRKKSGRKQKYRKAG